MDPRRALNTVLALALTFGARRAAAVEADSIWLGTLPAHRALCQSGTAPSPEELARVPTRFIAHLTGVGSIGSQYFESVVPDRNAGTIAWRLCAPVTAGVAAPPGFEAVEVPSRPAVFGLCAGESPAACWEAMRAQLGERVDAAQREAIGSLQPWGKLVPAPTLPLDAAAKDALAQEMVDPKAETLVPAGEPDAATVAPLRDASVPRKPLAAPAAAPPSAPAMHRPTRLVVAPLTAELAAALAQGIP